MKLYTTEECQQWVVRKAQYGTLIQSLFLEVHDNDLYISWHLADIPQKSFQHNVDRIKTNIDLIKNNYPKIEEILKDLRIYLVPKPSADTANACANDDYICYFARSTQIPFCMTDYITGHELGHGVQYRLCSKYSRNSREEGIEKFREYLSLRNAPRGICEVYDNDKDDYMKKEDFLYLHGTAEERTKYHGDWDTSPQEWFAEDFRYLFGVDKGEEYWGLPIPKPDDRIKEFILSL